MIYRRNGLRKQVRGKTRGPWSLGERDARKTCLLGKGGDMLREDSHPGSPISRLFIWKSQGRIPIEYSSAFQVCPFRVMVSTNKVGARAEGH